MTTVVYMNKYICNIYVFSEDMNKWYSETEKTYLKYVFKTIVGTNKYVPKHIISTWLVYDNFIYVSK